jgi:hypothetical protein
MNSEKIFCQNCGKELKPNQRPCPFCGCNNIKIEKPVGSGTVGIRGGLRLRQKREGFKRFMKEIIQGWFPSENKRQFPEGVDKTRIIDKKEDRTKSEYHEVVKDKKTGEIIREIHEPLSRHKHK